jgi:hypothetical protein
MAMPDRLQLLVQQQGVLVDEARIQLENVVSLRERTDWLPSKDRTVGSAASPKAATKGLVKASLRAVPWRRVATWGLMAGGAVLMARAGVEEVKEERRAETLSTRSRASGRAGRAHGSHGSTGAVSGSGAGGEGPGSVGRGSHLGYGDAVGGGLVDDERVSGLDEED